MKWAASLAVILPLATACSSASGPSSCSIGDAAWSEGALDPMNPCQICRASVQPTGWSQLAPGSPCGDGGAFCFAGSCQSGCWIPPIFYTAPGTLNPSVPCQSCQPERDSFGWSPVVGVAPVDQCPQGQYCGASGCRSGCFIEGNEHSAGDLDPGNGCQSCQPISATDDWTTLTDGERCGDGQLCLAGTCQSGCLVKGQAYAEGSFDPADGCLICSPGQSAVAWSAFSGSAAGGDCGGGGVCDRGACRQACWIDGGLISPGAPSPSDACRACLPASKSTDWSPLTGVPASGCDGGTICSAGRCISGCFIAGQAYLPGQAPPGDTGRCCGPTSNAEDWSAVFPTAATRQLELEPGNFYCSLFAGDFNGDGLVDLACFTEIFLNLGDLTFGAPTLLSGYPCSPIAADLNRDGVSDLVCPGSLWVSRRAPDASSSVDFVMGSFSMGDGGQVLGIEAADLNADGTPDLVLAENSGFVALMGIGDGGLLPGAYYPNDGTWFSTVSVVADFSGDGRPDVASLQSKPPASVFVDFNQGDGIFGPYAPVALSADSFYLTPTGLAAGDFNGDHRADLVVSFIDHLELLLSQGTGFGAASSLSIDASHGVIVGDFNGDGHLDLLVSGAAGKNLVAGVGDGTFYRPSFFNIPGVVQAVDLNGDGALDLIVADLSWTYWQNGCH